MFYRARLENYTNYICCARLEIYTNPTRNLYKLHFLVVPDSEITNYKFCFVPD